MMVMEKMTHEQIKEFAKDKELFIKNLFGKELEKSGIGFKDRYNEVFKAVS